MGFDLYGEGNFNKKPKIDWEESTEEEQKEYFEALDKFEEDNPGYYFRNNVWWWRPLWDYIYSIANDVLTEEDYERGQYNDYWLIDKNKALKLADKISEAISENHPQEFEEKYIKMLENAPDEKCDHCMGSGFRYDKHVQGTCNVCSGTGNVRPFACSYPFSAKNVIEFSKFVRNSGGFTIG